MNRWGLCPIRPVCLSFGHRFGGPDHGVGSDGAGGPPVGDLLPYLLHVSFIRSSIQAYRNFLLSFLLLRSAQPNPRAKSSLQCQYLLNHLRNHTLRKLIKVS
jgi:hypothetical protein